MRVVWRSLAGLSLLGGVILVVALLAPYQAGDDAEDAAAREWARVPTPRLPEGVITLRVVHAVNPRLPRFGDVQFDQLLRAAEETAFRSFGIRVALQSAGTISIEDLFRAMPRDTWRELQRAIVAPVQNSDDVASLERSAHGALVAEQLTLREIHRFAAAEMGWRSAPRSVEAAADALAVRQLEGLARWRKLAAGDGRPVIGAEPYHEWVAWAALGYGALPFDVVITNQLIASAELMGNAIHSMLRGGVAVGTTFYSRDGRFQAYVMASTFAFTDDLPAVVKIRDEGSYGAEEAATLAGAYLAHELGHLLLRLGHPYDNEACAMRPVVMFRFREWRQRLDPAKCPVGSSPQMTAGAVTLTYMRQFVR